MKTLAAAVSTVLALLILGFVDETTTQAQSNGPQRLTAEGSMAADPTGYWTPERFANAKPMPLPDAAATSAPATADAVASRTPQYSDGRPPSEAAGPPTLLYDPSLYPAESDVDAMASEVEPQNVGTFGAHFTSSRLIPLTADKQYPYRTVGKLFFTIPDQGDFVCSASVIQYRILATAGHCVHSGNGSASGFYTNWVFVPAFRDGAAPYQSWNWNEVWVTGDWFFGGGGVPNAADYAMIAVNDRLFGSKLKKIGKVTGFLGWQTLSLNPNHTTQLGYPCNLDSCQKMHQVTSGSFRNVAPNNVEYGSDARGGSSGGPWVQNFGVTASGQVGGLNPGQNRVVAVTSYGYISTDPKVQGASVIDNRWVGLFNNICAPPGNCTP